MSKYCQYNDLNIINDQEIKNSKTISITLFSTYLFNPKVKVKNVQNYI